MSADFLTRIAPDKRAEAAALRGRDLPPAPGPVRSLSAALRAPGTSVIAEIKRRSPSRGWIRRDLDAAAAAHAYAGAGAAALSVLTDGPHFGGHLDDLRAAKAAGLPVLRKDFIVDPLQLQEARWAGADAALLIVAMLSRAQLGELLATARELGLEVLVETHTAAEIEAAVDAGAEIIGINNRDLESLRVDLAVGEALMGLVPADRIRVGESGIFSPADRDRMARAGADAILVGTSLVRQGDPGAALRALIEGRA